ncbi:MAG: hypothetical protein HEQ27_05290 [Dolichospermum sp. JUN01]|nr:hypothetical protein [Dolichospermum sp. JUN01]
MKRFGNLNAALKYLRPTGSAEGSPVPDAPAGTPLKKFQDYKAGKVDLDYPRPSGSLPGDIKIVTLKPFALAASSTVLLKTTISNRSLTNLSTFGLTEAEAGFTSPADANGIDAEGFVPAKAVCRNTTGTTASTKNSKVTGLPYKSKANSSFTFPIGRTTAEPVWGEQKAAILAQVAASGGNKSVSFKPEKY